MKIYRFILIAATSLFLNAVSFAQQLNYEELPANVKKPIDGLLSSTLIRGIKELKIDAETCVKMVKREQEKYTPAELRTLENGFDNSSMRCFDLLTKIRNDFMDSKKRKYIREYPDGYKSELYGGYVEMKEYYEKNFKQPLMQIQAAHPKEEFGARLPLVDLIPLVSIAAELINIASGIFDFIKGNKEYVQTLTAAYLDEKLILACRIRTWAEIEAEGIPYNDSPYYTDGIRPERPVQNTKDGVTKVVDEIETLRVKYQNIKVERENRQNSSNGKNEDKDDNPYNDQNNVPGLGAVGANPPKKNN